MRKIVRILRTKVDNLLLILEKYVNYLLTCVGLLPEQLPEDLVIDVLSFCGEKGFYFKTNGSETYLCIKKDGTEFFAIHNSKITTNTIYKNLIKVYFTDVLNRNLCSFSSIDYSLSFVYKRIYIPYYKYFSKLEDLSPNDILTKTNKDFFV